MLNTICWVIGAAVLAHTTYRIAAAIHLYCIHQSQIDRYLRPDGKAYALVTGASDGIGLELVRVLLSRKFNLILHSRSEEKLHRICTALRKDFPGRDILFVAADAKDPQTAVPAVAKAVGQVEGRGGRLTVLVNNLGGQAGSLFGGEPTYNSFKDIPLSKINESLNLNALFPIQLTRVLYGSLADCGSVGGQGLVLNLGSYAGVYSIPLVAPYGASKAALHHLTRVLRVENSLSGTPVDVLGIMIGGVRTAGNDVAELGFAVPTAEAMAKSIVDRVGCGYDIVVGNWRHCMTGEAGKFMPKRLMQRLLNAEVNSLKEREEAIRPKKE